MHCEKNIPQIEALTDVHNLNKKGEVCNKIFYEVKTPFNLFQCLTMNN